MRSKSSLGEITVRVNCTYGGRPRLNDRCELVRYRYQASEDRSNREPEILYRCSG